jgi:hypothetical protein
MDIAAWLQDLGLQRYVSAFRDNDIDSEILPRLTAEDLIGIGVTSAGVAAGHIARRSKARGRDHSGLLPNNAAVARGMTVPLSLLLHSASL